MKEPIILRFVKVKNGKMYYRAYYIWKDYIIIISSRKKLAEASL